MHRSSTLHAHFLCTGVVPINLMCGGGGGDKAVAAALAVSGLAELAQAACVRTRRTFMAMEDWLHGR